MKLFPTKELKFKLIDSQVETLERLNRRTDGTESLSSAHTDRSFRGMVNGNRFQLISSSMGGSALCSMTGTIESGQGSVKVEIGKPFRILFGLFLLMPVINLVMMFLNGKDELSPIIMVCVALGQMLMIRYMFIGFAFNFFSKQSLGRLRDVLDIEWVKE